jgi:hypothetical protein
MGSLLSGEAANRLQSRVDPTPLWLCWGETAAQITRQLDDLAIVQGGGETGHRARCVATAFEKQTEEICRTGRVKFGAQPQSGPAIGKRSAAAGFMTDRARALIKARGGATCTARGAAAAGH